ncbi:CcdB [Hydrogenimonas sp.]|nr:CcdB [Hydrogenimonas sp.]
MAQFDVYKNPNRKTAERVPYLLDIQNDLLDGLATRTVVPLMTGVEPISHLNPIFSIENSEVVMVTQEMATVPKEYCKTKVVSLEDERSAIVAAIDFLVTGF